MFWFIPRKKKAKYRSKCGVSENLVSKKKNMKLKICRKSNNCIQVLR